MPKYISKFQKTTIALQRQICFEQLSNRAPDWSDQQLIGTFIVYMKDYKLTFGRKIEAYKPRTMTVAISCARMLEEKINEETCRTTRATTRAPDPPEQLFETIQSDLQTKYSKSARQRVYVGIVMKSGIASKSDF